jgi:hypothetical protein
MTATQEKGITVKLENRLFDFSGKSIEQAMVLAKILTDSSFVPSAYKGKPGDAVIAIEYGQEIGLPPLAALQSVAVINGKPSIYGDAVPGVIQTHPAYEYHTLDFTGDGETLAAVVTMKRRGAPIHTVTFSVADAKKAGLWGKTGPWTQYPKRMLGFRALGFAARDKFADKLKGLILAEEAQDYPDAINTTAVPMPKSTAEVKAESPAIQAEAVATGNPGEAQAVEYISEVQRRRLFALMKESGKTKENVKEYLASIGIDSSTHIPVGKYAEVEQFIIADAQEP